jgi:hypothetical protein
MTSEIYENIKIHLDGCSDCQSCVWNRCTGKIWRKHLTEIHF